ncbi:hypothetical protein [Cupriavidus gilardii]|uniref:hypothetical protein n=1 Tax=Cupriavidus gilardii TaxID=82541 RepID=UPI0021B22F79|nr:hypothetical protein [Cupriavidus gilardii]UXC34814.1 hypothetical protein N4G38_10210 [Cupriavidus gilardii]
MTTIKDGEPAFPCQAEGWTRSDASGLTARQYAAIHLRVPDSGTDWLDDMIRKAQRDEFAAKAMQGLCANDGYNNHPPATIANEAYGIADAMLAAREGKS